MLVLKQKMSTDPWVALLRRTHVTKRGVDRREVTFGARAQKCIGIPEGKCPIKYGLVTRV